jgi:hypothetical protein
LTVPYAVLGGIILITSYYLFNKNNTNRKTQHKNNKAGVRICHACQIEGVTNMTREP